MKYYGKISDPKDWVTKEYADTKQAKITASGLLKGDGNGGISAATAGSDYASPSSVPSQASVGTTGLISFKNSSGTQIFTIQLPLYNGGVV